MATDNPNQSGVSAAADSAREETAASESTTGPDSTGGELHAATDATATS